MGRASFFFIIFAFIFAATSVWAVGIGVYGTGGGSSGKFSDGYGENPAVTTVFYGCGMIVDTAVAKDSIFNYRLKAGYERASLSISDMRSTFDPINRLSMSHTFGFGILRTKTARFWIGWQFGFHYYRAREIFPPSVVLFYQDNSLILIPGKTSSYGFLGGNALLALGANFNLGDYTTLFVDLGVGYMGDFSLRYGLKGKTLGMLTSAGIMFRINDKFQGADTI